MKNICEFSQERAFEILINPPCVNANEKVADVNPLAGPHTRFGEGDLNQNICWLGKPHELIIWINKEKYKNLITNIYQRHKQVKSNKYIYFTLSLNRCHPCFYHIMRYSTAHPHIGRIEHELTLDLTSCQNLTADTC